jgi:putative zinc finger/helix-turn-helix YgiT family protein
MKCSHCDHEDLDTHRATVPFESMPHTILENVEVHDCPNCGGRARSYPRYAELFRTLARAVIEHTARLDGARVRFLRKYLGLTQADLGDQLDVQPETVSRWENDAQDVGATADRLLRMLVAFQAGDHHLSERIGRVAIAPASTWSVRLRFDEERGWHPVDRESASPDDEEGYPANP